MKKWSEIKQATLDKLFLEQSEAEQMGYLSKFRTLANEGLNIIANRVKPRIAMYEINTEDKNSIITMPDDFLSFADIVGFVNGERDYEMSFVGDKQLLLATPGTHKIFYNATWHYITEEETKNKSEEDLPIDISVLMCLPTYIASQVLKQDDIQQSTILKNEFELMLAGLDTNIMYEETHFISTGGWY